MVKIICGEVEPKVSRILNNPSVQKRKFWCLSLAASAVRVRLLYLNFCICHVQLVEYSEKASSFFSKLKTSFWVFTLLWAVSHGIALPSGCLTDILLHCTPTHRWELGQHRCKKPDAISWSVMQCKAPRHFKAFGGPVNDRVQGHTDNLQVLSALKETEMPPSFRSDTWGHSYWRRRKEYERMQKKEKRQSAF